MVPEQSTEPVTEEDVDWLRDLVARYGTDDDNPTEDSEKIVQNILADTDDRTPEEIIALQFEMEEAARERKPGKGGTKPNTKQKNARAAQLREEQIRNSRENRNEETIQTLQTQLEGSELFKLVKNDDPDADFFVETYAHWVCVSIENHGNPVLTQGDISIENFKRASGPGGQNMQKGESAHRAGHVWSGIVVEASNRSSEQSEREAKEKLEVKLKENIATWENYLGTAKIDMKPNEGIWDARERAIRTQVYKMARAT